MISNVSPQSPRYYKASGKFHPLSLLLPLPIAGLIALGLAWVYAWFCVINPFIYFSFIGTLIYGAAVGLVAGIVLSMSKNRSSKLGIITGLVIGLVAVWFAWVMWAGDTGYGDPSFSALPFAERLLAGPMAAYAYVFNGLSDYYQLAIGRRSASAGLDPETMELIWWIELAMIVGASTFCCWVSAQMGAYNEKTGNQAKTTLEAHARLEQNEPDIAEAAKAGSADALLALNVLSGEPAEEGRYLKVKLEQDSDDPEFNLLTLSDEVVTLDDKGETSTKSNETCERLYVSGAFAEAVKSHFLTTQPATSPQTEPEPA